MYCRGAENCWERSAGRRCAGVRAAESCHAAQRTASLCEPEANWSFRGDTATARRAPPATEVYKKEREPRNIVLLYVQHEDAALQNNEGWSKTNRKESRTAVSKLFLRCAPDGFLTWKQQPRVRGSERTGQMQAEEEEEEAIKEKRYNFATVLLRFLSFLLRAEVVRTSAGHRSALHPGPHRSKTGH